MRVSGVIVAAVLSLELAAAAFAAPVQKITLTMSEFQFAPKTVALRPGTAVEVTLINKGTVEHEFMLYPMPSMGGMSMDMDAYGAQNTYFKDIGAVELVADGKTSRPSRLERVMVAPGKTAVLRFTAKKAGTFEFGCHIPGHYEAGMKGILTVK